MLGAFLGNELRKPALYRSSAELLLTGQSAASLIGLQPEVSPDAADRFAQTQQSLARLPEVARLTLQAARVQRTPQEFLDQSEVSTKPNQDLLEFGVTDESPTLARRLATAYALQFTAFRRKLSASSLQSTEDYLRTQLESARVSAGPDSRIYKSLAARLRELEAIAPLQMPTTQLVSSAEEATKVQPRPLRSSAIGLVFGLLLGIALAFLRDSSDTRVRDPIELADGLGLPLLARLPASSRYARVITLEQPQSGGAEAFRILATNLDFANIEQGAVTIIVTSAGRNEGKTTVTANLGAALAHAGKHVLVIDLDLRRPGLAESFAASSEAVKPLGLGITDVALGSATAQRAMVEILQASPGASKKASNRPGSVGPGSLHLMGAGTIPPNPYEFIASRAVGDVFARLRDRFDVILIDSAPLLPVSDSIALTSQVDAMLLVSRLSSARRPVLAELTRVLHTLPAPILGFVVTDAPVLPDYGAPTYEGTFRDGHGASSSVLKEVRQTQQ